jgi:hypothetical protein
VEQTRAAGISHLGPVPVEKPRRRGATKGEAQLPGSFGAEVIAGFLGMGDPLRGGRSLLLPSPARHTVGIWFTEAGVLILTRTAGTGARNPDPAPVPATSKEGPLADRGSPGNRASSAAAVTHG